MAFGSGLISGLIRGKPNMPRFNQIVPGQEQATAIADNTANLPAAERLASETNIFNEDQMRRMLETSIPGYEGLKTQASGILSKEMAGEVPLGDRNMLELHDIAKSFGGGFGGSGAAGNLVARDLGLTELGEVQAGLSNTESWMNTINRLENPGLFNVSSMFLTPQQVMAQDTEERNAKFQHDWNKNVMDWQSSFGYLAANDIESTMGAVQSMAGSVMGSAAGGGGGGGGGM